MDNTQFRAKSSYARLPVSDLKRSIAFYTNGAGFEVDTLYPEEKPSFAALSNGPVHLELYVAAPDHKAIHGGLVLDGDGVMAAFEKLKSLGEIEWGPEVFHYGYREFSVRDPDGHSIIFSEETDDPPSSEA